MERITKIQSGVQIFYYNNGIIKNQIVNNINDEEKAIDFAKNNGYIPKDAKICYTEPALRNRVWKTYNLKRNEEENYHVRASAKYSGFSRRYFRDGGMK